jgi:hypothetical protein
MSGGSVKIRPGVGMLALLSAMNYKPWYALSELVDNSLASFLANRGRLAAAPFHQDWVTVRIELDKGLGEILVSDDAAGITAADIPRAFRPAERPPDTSGLAQFGVGMKSAACWYANSFTVSSAALNEDVRRSVSFDVREIVDEQIEELPVLVAPAAPDEHGTTVTLRDLHRSVPTGKTLGKIRRYLASIYRDYLRRGLLVLEVGGQRLEYENPEVLVARRWDADGNATSQEWRKEVVVELPGGKTVKGWAAMRARGSTSEAGLALLFRGKVVVGAGGPVGDVDGLFRPVEIFGAPNSFISQRLFGEFDVSEMQVAHSKDAILWGGDEEEFLERLGKALDEEPLPLLKMALGYRVTERGKAVDTKLKRAVDSTVGAAAESKGGEPENDDGKGHATDESVGGKFHLFGSEADVSFAVVLGTGEKWIRVLHEGDAGYRIEVDRNHAFMRSFAHLPGQEVEPVLRLAVAFGMAEIEAIHAGAQDPGAVRSRLNHLLRGPLAEITVDDLAGARV